MNFRPTIATGEKAMQLKRVLSVITAALALCYAFAITVASTANAATVKEPDTLTIAWLPNDASDGLAGMRDELAKAISDATGKKVVNKLTTDYVIAISALESGEAQIGWFGANEYLTSHAGHPEVIALAVNTGPSGTLKDSLYNSRFLVKKGNEGAYKSGGSYGIDHIAGKKMSFVSTSSTSGFNMPAAAILGQFTKEAKWTHLTKEDLTQGGPGKFFSQVMFAGSHQVSLVNLVTGRSDVSAVCDFCVGNQVNLVSGTENTPGAVYKIKEGADAPFTDLVGQEFVIIKNIPVLNPPVEVNSNYLTKKTMDEITKALISDKVANNPKIFPPKGSQGSDFHQPERFTKVTDAWYNPMRSVLGIK